MEVEQYQGRQLLVQLLNQVHAARDRLNLALRAVAMPGAVSDLINSCVDYLLLANTRMANRFNPQLQQLQPVQQLWEKYWLTLPGVRVWHVSYAAAGVQWNDDRGWCSRIVWPDTPSDPYFRAALETHMRRPGNDSPFIPVLADEMQADDFARRYREQNPGQWCDVSELNLSKFDMVYSTSVLVSELDIDTDRALPEYESEYLILHRHDPYRPRDDDGWWHLFPDDDFMSKAVMSRFGTKRPVALAI